MSQNIHEALDNLEAQLSALVGGLDPGGENDLLEIIGENIDAVRVAVETQSVAQITAQNTNFSNLATALTTLQLFCQSQNFYQVNNIFVPYTPASTDGGEGIPAPEPFTEITEGETYFKNRKCFMANAIIDDFVAFLDYWDNWQLDELTNLSLVAYLAASVAALAALIENVVIIGISLGSVASYLHNLVQYAYENMAGIEFSDISSAITTNRDDLLCALFEADTVVVARSDFVSVLANAGMSQVNQGFVIVALDYTYLNYLFYKDDPNVEAAFRVATGYDCSGCEGNCDDRGGVQTTVVSDNGLTIQLTPTGLWGGYYYVKWYIDATPNFQLCGGLDTFSNFSVVSGAINPAPNGAVRMWSNIPHPGQGGDRYQGNTLPTVPITGVRVLQIKSPTNFTLQFDYVRE